MDFERELADIEQHLLTEDPDLGEQLDTFGQVSGPAQRGTRQRRLLAVVALVCLVLAVVSALAAGAATTHGAPLKVEQRHSR